MLIKQKKFDEALECVRLLNTLANRASKVLFLIHQCMTYYMQGNRNKSIMHIANAEGVDSPTLQALIKETDECTFDTFLKSLHTERISIAHMFANIEGYSLLRLQTKDESFGRFDAYLSHVLFYFKYVQNLNFLKSVDDHTRAINAIKEDYALGRYNSTNLMTTIKEEYDKRKKNVDVIYVAATIFISPFVTSYNLFLENKIKSKLVRLALYVKLFKLKHKRFPESLTELIKEYPDCEKDNGLYDRYSGERFKYATEDGAVFVYSVGQNQTDDGCDSSRKPVPLARPKDIVVKVK